MKAAKYLLGFGVIYVVGTAAASGLCSAVFTGGNCFGETRGESSRNCRESRCMTDSAERDRRGAEDVQVILYDEITIEVIRPSGSNRLRVGNTGDRIISGPTISGDTCTIVILEKLGRRIMKVYRLPSFSVIKSVVI